MPTRIQVFPGVSRYLFQASRSFPLLHQQRYGSHQGSPQRDHTQVLLSSDRRSHFISEVLHQLSKQLGVSWDLHSPWRPQSNGMVVKMNQTLKGHISKMSGNFLEMVLALALLWIRVQAWTTLKVSSYVYVWETIATFPGSKEQIGNQETEYLISLGKSLN